MHMGIKVFRQAWPKLYAKIKREEPDFAFVMIPELVDGHNFHVHMLSPFCPADERWIKDEPRKRGLGYINEIKPVESKYKAGWYCAKYLSKDMVAVWPKGFQRARKSKFWPSLPEPESWTQVKWDVIPARESPFQDMVFWQQRGYKVHRV